MPSLLAVVGPVVRHLQMEQVEAIQVLLLELLLQQRVVVVAGLATMTVLLVALAAVAV